MKYYFNELSLKTNQFQADQGDCLNEFAVLNAMLRRALGARLCVDPEFHSQLFEYRLKQDYLIRDWLNDKRVDFDIRSRFRLLINSDLEMPIIPEDDKATLLVVQNSIFEVPETTRAFGIGRSGLGAALIYKSINVSLRSHPHWEGEYLRIAHSHLDEEILRESIHDIPHLSKWIHVLNHLEFLETIAFKRFFEDHNFVLERFPNLEATKLIEDCYDHDGFLARCRTLINENEKRAAYIDLAKKVAQLNGYTACGSNVRDLNRDTQGRQHVVYHAGFGRKTIYISVDAKTGEFEVFDHKGDHIAIHFLNGEPSSKPAVSGRKLNLP